jgi:hypothetical protein
MKRHRIRAADIVFLLQFDGREISNRECECSQHPTLCPIDLHRFRHLQSLAEDEPAESLPHLHNFAASCGLAGCSCAMKSHEVRGCWCGAIAATAANSHERK